MPDPRDPLGPLEDPVGSDVPEFKEIAGTKKTRRRSLFREIVELLLIVPIGSGGTRLFLLPYQVDGASMTPYLANGEHLFVNRTAYSHIDLDDIIDALPGEDREGNNEVIRSVSHNAVT